MTYQLIFSPVVKRELEQSLLWTEAHFGKKQRAAYEKLIGKSLRFLAKSPLKAPSRTREDIGKGTRCLHISRIGKPARHFFIYHVTPNHTVHIARFLHDSMDISTALA
jgi:plasmid stabilization system protein ParE